MGRSKITIKRRLTQIDFGDYCELSGRGTIDDGNLTIVLLALMCGKQIYTVLS